MAILNHNLPVTILASIFIPISVGTSIFGMNIHELNGNGPRIWIFFLTTICLGLLALGCWLSMTRLLQWRSKFLSRDHEGVSRWDRLTTICWLVHHRHSLWMIRSGAPLSLISDGRTTFDATHEDISTEWPVDYVTRARYVFFQDEGRQDPFPSKP